MSEQLSESAIVRELANAVVKRITRRVIRELQRMNVTMSGDDSGLKSTWDEICVQIQHEYSFYWEAYDDVARAHVAGHVEQLTKHEADAMWLQTDQGSDWKCKDPEDREPYPVYRGDIVNYITQEHVYAEAGCWSNARIRAYIYGPIS